MPRSAASLGGRKAGGRKRLQKPIPPHQRKEREPGGTRGPAKPAGGGGGGGPGNCHGTKEGKNSRPNSSKKEGPEPFLLSLPHFLTRGGLKWGKVIMSPNLA